MVDETDTGGTNVGDFLKRRITRRQAIKVGGLAAAGLILSRPLIETIRPQSTFANDYRPVCHFKVLSIEKSDSCSSIPIARNDIICIDPCPLPSPSPNLGSCAHRLGGQDFIITQIEVKGIQDTLPPCTFNVSLATTKTPCPTCSSGIKLRFVKYKANNPNVIQTF